MGFVKTEYRNSLSIYNADKVVKLVSLLLRFSVCQVINFGVAAIKVGHDCPDHFCTGV